MGARFILTDKTIAKTKPAPAGARYVLWDAVAPSLGLMVTARGHKSFILQRRINGRMVKLTLGAYPALGLAQAREAAQAALKQAAKGVDPRHARAAPVSASGRRRDSFEAAAESYIKREVEKKLRPRTQEEIVRTLRKVLVPRWGTLSLADIGVQEIHELLDELVDAGTPVAANRTYSMLRRFLGWAVERRLIDHNAAMAVRKPAKEQARSRVLGDREVREVWLEAGRMAWPFGSFFRALILTGQRRSEIAGMKWSELDDDGRLWTIPAERAKNARQHDVPLSAPMRAMLAEAPRFEASDLVFTTNGATAISGFSRAKRRLDAAILHGRRRALAETGGDPAKAKPPGNWTLHDLRRTCATGMGALGVHPHVIEAALNHAGGYRAGVAGVYQRQTYLEERSQAFEIWAEHLAALSQGRTPKVVALRGRP